MKIIKLDAIDSTNSYLRALSTREILDDYTVVTARFQTAGKGQMGTQWVVEQGKNLTFSVFKKIEQLENNQGFFISMATSLAIYHALKQLQIPKLAIKWPNDILADNHKICGILIENVIQNNKMTAAVIGIGLNVNQLQFETHFRATSLRRNTGIQYDLNEVLFVILAQLKAFFQFIETQSFEQLQHAYESLLFRKDKPSTFLNANNERFMGFIKGVEKSGKLKVLLEDDVLKTFDLKEIKLLY
ncbi:biotin--[acetyl-CoA-carboxylase] ligase [Kordia zhangzhouensis]|uniref:biotin--[acetyl-CoA-carboxylase] ligase n=1 Tax=Kordia zhangzhouensis TaxID=1620405 RepID=UPI000629BA3C|nr:biotin--[acetyl-CoA-carboxylase] ligase [Kordia zhangzhouensis]